MKESKASLGKWCAKVMKRSGLSRNDKFVSKSEFVKRGFLGSGGLARFRDRLWAAAFTTRSIAKMGDKAVQLLASAHRQKIYKAIAVDEN